MERKSFSLEVKEVDSQGIFAGTANVYNIKDLAGDIVMPGTFAESIASKSRLPLLYEHQDAIGIIDVSETDKGVECVGQIALETSLGKDVYALMKMGAITGLSIGFLPLEWKWEGDTRIISKGTLLEVSAVAVPANQLARISEVKAADEAKKELAKLEEEIKTPILAIRLSALRTKILMLRNQVSL